MKTLLKIIETYRTDTEEEAKALLNEMKENEAEEGYELKTYSYEKKEKKKKGIVEDEGYQVKVTKEFRGFWEEEME